LSHRRDIIIRAAQKNGRLPFRVLLNPYLHGDTAYSLPRRDGWGVITRRIAKFPYRRRGDLPPVNHPPVAHKLSANVQTSARLFRAALSHRRDIIIRGAQKRDDIRPCHSVFY